MRDQRWGRHTPGVVLAAGARAEVRREGGWVEGNQRAMQRHPTAPSPTHIYARTRHPFTSQTNIHKQGYSRDPHPFPALFPFGYTTPTLLSPYLLPLRLSQ